MAQPGGKIRGFSSLASLLRDRGHRHRPVTQELEDRAAPSGRTIRRRIGSGELESLAPMCWHAPDAFTAVRLVRACGDRRARLIVLHGLLRVRYRPACASRSMDQAHTVARFPPPA